MRIKHITILSWIALSAGCASVSQQTAREMSESAVARTGTECQDAVDTAEVQDDIKWSRVVATPVLTVASAGLLPAIVGANAALDYADRKNASNMRVACGYDPIERDEILTDVATNAGISVGLGAVDLGLGTDVANIQDAASNSSN
jgi:hypothetical protein